MSTRIVIAGAGGFGRGVYGWLMDSWVHRDEHQIAEVVFIDDARQPVVVPQAEIVGSIQDYLPVHGDEVLCAIGAPNVRRGVVELLRTRGATFHTFIDDRAIVGSRVRVGTGAVICPGVVISADANVGRHVHINFNSSIGHDTVLGDFTTLSPSVNVMGEVHVGESVFVGGSAAVLPRLQIAVGATVGAGAVVVKSIKAHTTVVGNPARATKNPEELA